MVMTTVAGGLFMMLVHTVTSKMAPAEYGIFFALLRCLILLGIPAAGLQTVFAQQAAAVITETQAHQLVRTGKVILSAIFFLWLAMAFVVFLWQEKIFTLLKITSPAALWITMLVVLTSLWLPILKGLLQGRQNFTGLGWVAIFDGVGRFAAVTLIVLFMGGQAAGAMSGALLGQGGAMVISLWLLRDFFRTSSANFFWRPWLGRVVPLTIGFGALLFLQNADVLFVQSVFPENKAPYFYMPAAMIGFGLMQFTGPLAAVMFPKIVRSAARSEKSDALRLTFLTTACLGGLVAIGSTLFPELPLRILYFKTPACLQAAPLVPWFGWCMFLMTLANVLVGNLLARGEFKIVPWLVFIAAAYGIALAILKNHLPSMEVLIGLKRVVQTLGVFSLFLLMAAAGFTWLKK
ncbi:MAG: hypothetical protein ACR2H1_07695 [Limisphaerales bacterium]